jgi:Fur family zinc uptake transcriptional regulator
MKCYIISIQNCEGLIKMSVGFDKHDHSACIKDALQSASSYCAKHKLQFTKNRQRVLEILVAQHKAMGAYDIMPLMQSDGQTAQPPAVYRALDFLVAHGFAHKVEKRNAYIACAHPGQDHIPAFLICRSCNTVEEAITGPVLIPLGSAAQKSGFRIETTVVEAEGLCPKCQ